MRKINPRVDIAFKKIFGTESNKDLLVSLINSIVGEEDRVVDVTLMNPYNQKNFKKDKLSILDIKAKGSTGKKFNIEIQITDEADYDKRALYYWARLYTEQLKESEEYSSLKKVIGIHILNFTSIPRAQKYHNAFHITEKETGLKYFKELELHTIELKKFTDELDKEFGDIGSKIQNALDMWSAFLTGRELFVEAELPQSLDASPIKKAIEVLSVMSFSDEEREVYEGQLKWLRIEANTLKKAEEKGEKRGEKRGEKKGREEGKKEEKIAIAKNMLDDGFSAEQVIKLTGLSQDKIASLREIAPQTL